MLHKHDWKLYKLCYKWYSASYLQKVRAIKIYKCTKCNKLKEVVSSKYESPYIICAKAEVDKLIKNGYIPYERYELMQINNK